MKYSEQGMESVRHQFDAFCKQAMRWESNDYEQHRAWRAKHEISMSDLPQAAQMKWAVYEEYPSDSAHFKVHGFDISIKNQQLAAALTMLPDDKREIVLLAYFLDMSDPEIAELLHIVRQTVQYRRVKSLKELRKRMEAEHEEQ